MKYNFSFQVRIYDNVNLIKAVSPQVRFRCKLPSVFRIAFQKHTHTQKKCIDEGRRGTQFILDKCKVTVTSHVSEETTLIHQLAKGVLAWQSA